MNQTKIDSTNAAAREARRYREDPTLTRICEEGPNCKPAEFAFAHAGSHHTVTFLICAAHEAEAIDPEIARESATVRI